MSDFMTKLSPNTVSQIFDGQPPYSADSRKEYPTKILLEGVGWVEVKTKTNLIINGLLEDVKKKIEAGDYVKTSAPTSTESFIYHPYR